MERIIIHVDMDAFFAAVEVRDNPALSGQPLIIGALPNERGVVSTCSYEARVFGVRSGMSIKDAYRRCPDGIYMHPNMSKYHDVSMQIGAIWSDYTDLVERVALDEGYLDVSGSAHLYGGAVNIGLAIKRRTREETGLSCSVGIGYNMMTAKLASEEKKPDGFFQIQDAAQFKALVADRDVRVLFGVGQKTAERLHAASIKTVRDIHHQAPIILSLFGENQGRKLLDYAQGIDYRRVSTQTEAKSIGKERTFQEDITDFSYLKDMLLLLAKQLSFELHQKGLYAGTITLKITYSNMKGITRSKTGEPTNRAAEIYAVAAAQLEQIERLKVRLVGISLSSLSKTGGRQLSLLDDGQAAQRDKLDELSFQLQKKYGKGVIKTAKELDAEHNLKK